MNDDVTDLAAENIILNKKNTLLMPLILNAYFGERMIKLFLENTSNLTHEFFMTILRLGEFGLYIFL